MKLVRFLFLLSFVFFYSTTKAAEATMIPDTSIVRLMNTFQYRAAAKALNSKLKKTNRKDFDKLLYYNNQLSMAYIRIGLNDSALICAKRSMHWSVMSLDSVLISDAWKVNAYSYNLSGKLDSAIIYNQMMIGYAERKGDKRLMRNSMSSLGAIMNQNKKFNEALKYHRNAFLLTEEIKDSLSYTIMNYNMGLTYSNLGKPDSSLYYLDKSLQYSLKEKHYEAAMFAYTTTTDIYLQLGNFRKWKETSIALYNLADSLNNYQFMAQANSNLLYGLTKNKNFKEAILYGNKALEILKVYHYPSLQIEVDSSMYLVNKSIGNFESALNYLEAYYKQKSILLNEDQKKQLSEIQTRLDVKEKDLKITQQKLRLIRWQRSILWIVFAMTLFVIVIIASVMYVVRYHRFRKELYKKEKYLDKQLADTKQWMEGVFLSDSFIPTTLRHLTSEEETKPINQDVLSPKSILFSDLRETIVKQKLYLNPELNLQMVIKLLGTNKKYLYEAINSNTDNNFRNFINRYRVDHAKKIIEENIMQKSNINLSEIYNISGFNNPSSFFRTFKAITGLTPKEYATEVELEVKEEKLSGSI